MVRVLAVVQQVETMRAHRMLVVCYVATENLVSKILAISSSLDEIRVAPTKIKTVDEPVVGVLYCVENAHTKVVTVAIAITMVRVITDGSLSGSITVVRYAKVEQDPFNSDMDEVRVLFIRVSEEQD